MKKTKPEPIVISFNNIFGERKSRELYKGDVLSLGIGGDVSLAKIHISCIKDNIIELDLTNLLFYINALLPESGNDKVLKLLGLSDILKATSRDIEKFQEQMAELQKVRNINIEIEEIEKNGELD